MPVRFFIFTIFLSLLYSCGKFSFYDQKSDEIICTVGSFNLYESDLEELYVSPKGGEDSLVMREFYVKRWIDGKVKQTAANKAVEELNLETIDRLVEIYRNALIVNSYQQSFVNRLIDTMVIEDTVKAYYKANRSRFILHSPIVKAYIARVPITVRNIDKIEDMFFGNAQELSDFKTICDKNSYPFLDMTGIWYNFSELLEHVPFKQMDYDAFLKENKTFILKDKAFTYLVRIVEYVLTGAPSPIEKEITGIKKQVIFNRKNKIIKELNDSLRTSALKNNEVIFRAQ